LRQENLRYAAGLREVSDAAFKTRSEHFLGLLDLAQFKERLAGRLSGDEAETPCCALIHQPVLLLDEPTTVWIRSRAASSGTFAQLATSMTTVVATPYPDEAERSRIALMYEGKIQQCDTPANVKASLGVQRLEVYLPVMQLDQAESILKHNADLRRWFQMCNAWDRLTSSPSRSLTKSGALEQQQFRSKILPPIPQPREHLVARLREIKGDSSQLPRIYPPTTGWNGDWRAKSQ